MELLTNNLKNLVYPLKYKNKEGALLEKILKLDSNEEAIELYGTLDANLRHAEKEFHVRISARNHRLKIIGTKKDVEAAAEYFAERLKQIRKKSHSVNEKKITKEAITKDYTKKQSSSGAIQFVHHGRVILGRTDNQEKYLKKIFEHDIVIATGPAGTGKTYMAMAAAVEFLKKKEVSKIILTRPAVEAGENLGFLPGDLAAKVNPYLRPLYDALYDMMEYEEVLRCLDRGIIEVAPLAYMRGRTLNDAFVILDEAQNCSHSQIKMFLTRLGEFSKTIVTGDTTQIDLPRGTKSGLVELKKILRGIQGISFIELETIDVVRHPLVQEIITAYETFEKSE